MKTNQNLNRFIWVILMATAFLLQLILPWWSIAIAAFAFGFFFKQRYPFLNGFLAIFILWAAAAGYISYINDGILAQRLTNLLNLPYNFLPVIITGMVGGITGGTAVLTGFYLRKLTSR
jgi:hypothetical protein